MARRSTIRKNPLEDLDQATAKDSAPQAEGGAAIVETSPRRSASEKPKGTKARAAHKGNGEPSDGTRRANGGRLELLGGSFGTGLTSISTQGKDRRLGFVAPQGEHVDLETTIDAVDVMSDREEHRLLSAAGWAVAAGAFLGPVGLALGGGIRLLRPRKMVVNARLHDGRTIVARTDSVTAAALQKFVATDTQPAEGKAAPA